MGSSSSKIIEPLVKKEPGQRHILIAVDDSKHAKRAFDWYASSQNKEEDRIFVHHTIEVPKAYRAATIGLPAQANLPSVVRDARKRAQCIRDIFLSRCKEKDLRCEFIIAEPSDPRTELLKAVDQYQADLIVLGNRGEYFGNISDYMLHHAHVPILIIPPKGLRRPKDLSN